MSTNYKEIVQCIEDFDTAIASVYKTGEVFSVSMLTPFSSSSIVVMRNKLIRLLQNSFFTVNGYINVSSLLVFCYTYGFKCSTVGPMVSASSFSIRYSNLSIEVCV